MESFHLPVETISTTGGGGGEGGGGGGIKIKKVKTDPGSYRPISLLPVVSKLIEKSIQSQIISFMEQSHQWNSNNHAYKPKHSTTTTLLELSDTIFQACDEKSIAVVMGIDQMAAFDSVLHNILYEKLRLYNFDNDTISWIRSYLEHRTQYVVVGAHSSSMVPVDNGVPQGSVLGPVLYTLYLNELPDLINEYKYCEDDVHTPSANLFGTNCDRCRSLPSYADDTSYVTYIRDRATNLQRIEQILARIKSFLNNNKLTVNEGKTVLIKQMMKQKRARIQSHHDGPEQRPKGDHRGQGHATLGSHTAGQHHLAETSRDR